MGHSRCHYLHQHCRLLHLDPFAHCTTGQRVVRHPPHLHLHIETNQRTNRYVQVNEIWDRISKALILLVDAGLNYYFLRTVKRRLVLRHGLTKYAPLVSFNAKLMVVSILMDVSFS